ncbi:hypothetical protein ES705_29220 [subsurface metagenome]
MSYWVEKAERDLAIARQGAQLRAEQEAAGAAELAQKEAAEAAELARAVAIKFPDMKALLYQI